MREVAISKIFDKIKKTPYDLVLYSDLYGLCRQPDTEADFAHKSNKKMRSLLIDNIRKIEDKAGAYELYRRSLLFDATTDLDSYMLYIEIDRPLHERFYQPRRKRLKELVDALQDLADDKLDELFLSEPPRVGKTTMLMFFVTWIIGRDSERTNLYSAYSDTITNAFYKGILEVLTDNVTYKWSDVFPNAKIVATNASEETINVDRNKRYPSLTCRSLYGTLNGACDCNGMLISDDLIGGIEEALNKDRLMSAWSKVDNNLIPRAKESAKILWCGTRWSIIDPAGNRMALLENDERFKHRRYRIINLPALNENDESNFEYDYGVGFSTDYYRQRRASFEKNNDMASWDAQYQGQPIEREGTLFTPNDFRFYNGELPAGEPDRIFMAVDPAFGGGDFVASPVCYQYGDDVYVADVVYNNGDKKVTQPIIVNKIIQHNVKAAQFEANKSTESYKEEVERQLKDKGIRINITCKAAPTTKSKEQRIFDKAPEIRECMIFLEQGKRSKEYELFMQSVYSFKMFGKNIHDDAPDSLGQAMDMAFHSVKKLEIFKRPL